MSIVLSIVIATAAITAMAVFRITVFRNALNARLKDDRSGNACEATGCTRSCSEAVRATDDSNNESNRRASHAS